MAKKIMNKKQEKSLKKALILGGIVLVGVAVVIPFMTVKPDAPKLWADTHKFFTDVKTNVSNNGAFLGIATALGFGGAVLLRKTK